MLSTQVLKIYRKFRLPNVGMIPGTGKRYHTQTPANRALESAIYNEKVNRLWSEHEGESVRLLLLPDDTRSIEDLEGDTYNPDANPDIPAATLARERKEFIERINNDGVWGIVGEYRCNTCRQWTTADSVWGFVGDDWQGSGYDLDIKAATLQAAGLWED